MKYISFTLFLLCSVSAHSQALTKQVAKKINCDSATTQAMMNACAAQEYRETDAIRLSTVRQIVKQYKSDTIFVANLWKAEAIWIKWRDAAVDVKFPGEATRHYGSVQPMCHAMYLNEITKQHIAYLKQWLEGIEEGDVCRGSVRMKPAK
jgi:uncharacterized protein YecT (DUF1311 family)